MIHKNMNGYTIFAHETVPSQGYHVVLGSRRTSYGYEYVTACVTNIDLDTEWFWGHYSGSDFDHGIAAAVEDFNLRRSE